MKHLALIASVMLWAVRAGAAAPDTITVAVDATQPGAKISRHLFGIS